MLARFTIPKKKQGSTRKLNDQAKLPDHRACNQHTLVQHNGEQSAKHSYIEMHSDVGTFIGGFKHTNDNAVTEFFIYLFIYLFPQVF